MVCHGLPQLDPLDRNTRQVANGHEAMSEGIAVMLVEDWEQHPGEQGGDGEAETVVPLPASQSRANQDQREGDEEADAGGMEEGGSCGSHGRAEEGCQRIPTRSNPHDAVDAYRHDR